MLSWKIEEYVILMWVTYSVASHIHDMRVDLTFAQVFFSHDHLNWE